MSPRSSSRAMRRAVRALCFTASMASMSQPCPTRLCARGEVAKRSVEMSALRHPHRVPSPPAAMKVGAPCYESCARPGHGSAVELR